ncbi:MAG: zf-HC2 domain-containing protein [Pseudomonadota bacterium]
MTETIRDETLTAYLDGALSEAERREVEIALEQDGALRARLHDLDLPTDALRTAFESALELAPEPPDVSVPDSTGGANPRWAIAALVIFGATLGLLLGSLWSPFPESKDTADWKLAVANYQVLYVPQTLAAPAPDRLAAERRLAELSEALGRDLTQAVDAQGLEFRRAQMLGLEGQPLVQIAYMGPNNSPVAICVTPVDTATRAPSAETIAGLAAAHWVQDGFGFLVIGGADLDFVSDVADDIRARL